MKLPKSKFHHEPKGSGSVVTREVSEPVFNELVDSQIEAVADTSGLMLRFIGARGDYRKRGRCSTAAIRLSSRCSVGP